MFPSWSVCYMNINLYYTTTWTNFYPWPCCTSGHHNPSMNLEDTTIRERKSKGDLRVVGCVWGCEQEGASSCVWGRSTVLLSWRKHMRWTHRNYMWALYHFPLPVGWPFSLCKSLQIWISLYWRQSTWDSAIRVLLLWGVYSLLLLIHP